MKTTTRTWEPGDINLETVAIELDPKTMKFLSFEKDTFSSNEDLRNELLKSNEDCEDFDESDLDHLLTKNAVRHAWKDSLAIESSLPKEKAALIEKHFEEIKGSVCRFPAFLKMREEIEQLNESAKNPFGGLVAIALSEIDRQNIERIENAIPDFMESLVRKVDKIERKKANV